MKEVKFSRKASITSVGTLQDEPGLCSAEDPKVRDDCRIKSCPPRADRKMSVRRRSVCATGMKNNEVYRGPDLLT